jgi:hypothetical protein
MKYAKISMVVRWAEGTTVLSAGVTTADDDHPLVLERPDLFTDAAPAAHLRTPKPPAEESPGPKVERATRAPGEKRGQGKRG